jgi:6-phosphogluconolactonase (cycloisomerase 2 family)
VLGYSIDRQTGALNPLPGFPVAVGANADSISIDPTNQFLYVRNGGAGTVIGFELNAAAGELTPMPGSRTQERISRGAMPLLEHVG